MRRKRREDFRPWGTFSAARLIGLVGTMGLVVACSGNDDGPNNAGGASTTGASGSGSTSSGASGSSTTGGSGGSSSGSGAAGSTGTSGAGNGGSQGAGGAAAVDAGTDRSDGRSGSGGTGGSGGSGTDAGASQCQELVAKCSLIDPGSGAVHTCVVTGMQGNAAACETSYAGCKQTCGAALCTRIGTICHDKDEPCHEMGHAGVAGPCFDRALECFALCM